MMVDDAARIGLRNAYRCENLQSKKWTNEVLTKECWDES